MMIDDPAFKDEYVEIDVPHDNSCLFWACSFSFLLTSQSDSELKNRFVMLFGEESIQEFEHVKRLIQGYNPFSCINIFYDSVLNKLVREIFRKNVINYISENKQDFKDFFFYYFLVTDI